MAIVREGAQKGRTEYALGLLRRGGCCPGVVTFTISAAGALEGFGLG